MANRHLLSVLSQNGLAALVGVKHRHHNLVALAILSIILSVSLVAFSSAAKPTGQQLAWSRQQHLNHADKQQQQQQQLSLSPKYQMLEDIQGESEKARDAPADHHGIWQDNPIAPARNRDELIDQLKLARQLLDEQLEADAAALSSSLPVTTTTINNNAPHRQQYDIPALDLSNNELRYNPSDYYLANNLNPLKSKSDQEANLLSRELANELLMRQVHLAPNSLLSANSRRHPSPKHPLSLSTPTHLNGGNRIIIHLNDEDDKLDNNNNANTNERLQNFHPDLGPQYAGQLGRTRAVTATASDTEANSISKLEAADKRMLLEDSDLDPKASFGTIQRQPVKDSSAGQQQASGNEPSKLVENKRQGGDNANDVDDGEDNDDLGDSDKKSSIPSPDNNSNENTDQKTDQSAKRFTTLLEDEQQPNADDNKATSLVAPDPSTPASGSTKQASPAIGMKSANLETGKQVEIKPASDAGKSLLRQVYDKLIGYVPFLGSPINGDGQDKAKNSTTSGTLQVQGLQQTSTSNSSDGGMVDHNQLTDATKTDSSRSQVQQQDPNEIRANKMTDEANAKPGVSSMAELSVKTEANGETENKSSVDDKTKTNDKNNINDKSLGDTHESGDGSSRTSNNDHENQDNTKPQPADDSANLGAVEEGRDDDLAGQESLSSPSMGIFNDDNGNQSKQKPSPMTRTGTPTYNMKRVHLEHDIQAKSLSPPSLMDDVELDKVLGQQRHHSIDEKLEPFKKISLIRQSNVVMPLTAADDLLLQASGPGSLNDNNDAGSKYIYAPTQHYYLNTGRLVDAGSNGHDNNRNDEDRASQRAAFFSQFKMDIDGLHGQQQQHQSSQFQPGGHIYASSYEPLKPSYAYQQKGAGLEGLLINGPSGSTLTGAGNSKSNDLYFLVMVGAFCVMAMAVVLAAGLFAYRVQQNRKSSNDLDYPTYGVVGPNNLNGKCGAAAFVGGYLGHHHHPGGLGPGSSGSFGSKSGSSKHLPDLYACSDSGLASTDKGSSKKASSASASSDPQLQQSHLQSSVANNRSSQVGTNFMANNQDAARMYHYQHQKQQMIISDRSSAGRHTSASDLDSEDENEDGSYTVYECPGLASAHEMEIKNPLFNDDRSP